MKHPAPATILAIEKFVPSYRYEQADVTSFVRAWLEEGVEDTAVRRLLAVYARAGVKARGSVIPIEEVFATSDFESRNDRYAQVAREAGVDLARRVLAAAQLAPADIGLIVSVSCTGFMIPSLDAYVADSLGMGPRLARLPITESGCAGGVVGLLRATDYLAAHPERAVLMLAVEMCSLTFQRWDRSATNVVSTAIFGDGGAACVLVGAEHPLARSNSALVRIAAGESVFFPGTTHLMGFRLRNQGLQIVLDRELAPFVRTNVAGAVDAFLKACALERSDIARWILHPGGRRVIEVMAERLGLKDGDLAATEAVLGQHGNMSSVTVLFVLDEVLRRSRPASGAHGVLGAFGPGFGAELALLEFV